MSETHSLCPVDMIRLTSCHTGMPYYMKPGIISGLFTSGDGGTLVLLNHKPEHLHNQTVPRTLLVRETPDEIQRAVLTCPATL